MLNEILLIGSIIVIYGMTLVLYRIFGKQGLYTFTIIATISANIEVLIVINAFGMEMTLGNVIFASTFLITDIISEIYGKKDAKLAVYLGISTSVYPCRKRFCDACNEDNFFKYTKINAYKYDCICHSTAI